MASFFEGLKRMAQGKPVFTNEDQNDAPVYRKEEEQPDDQQQPAVVQERTAGPKIIPEAIIERIECRIDGSQMTCDFTIKNISKVMVELDKIRLLGTMKELDRQLQPGETREFPVYSGTVMRNNYETRLELHYKDQNGDYFCAIHNIEFEKQPDNTYIVHRVRFVPPVRDV